MPFDKMFPAIKRTSCQCLDLPIWNFTLSGFNAELICVIFIDLGLDTTHLRANWNKILYTSLFSVLPFNRSHHLTNTIL